jgi:hypothetical protein
MRADSDNDIFWREARAAQLRMTGTIIQHSREIAKKISISGGRVAFSTKKWHETLIHAAAISR